MKNVSDLLTVEGDDWLVALALSKFAVALSENDTSTLYVDPSLTFAGSVKVATTCTGQVAVQSRKFALLRSSVQLLKSGFTGAVTSVGATLSTVIGKVFEPVARSWSFTVTVTVSDADAVPNGDFKSAYRCVMPVEVVDPRPVPVPSVKFPTSVV